MTPDARASSAFVSQWLRRNEAAGLSGVDISPDKGHRYLTVVLDLQSGAVLFVGDGNGADALLPFWRWLRASHAQFELLHRTKS